MLLQVRMSCNNKCILDTTRVRLGEDRCITCATAYMPRALRSSYIGREWEYVAARDLAAQLLFQQSKTVLL
jgi:hypothetical protein